MYVTLILAALDRPQHSTSTKPIWDSLNLLLDGLLSHTCLDRPYMNQPKGPCYSTLLRLFFDCDHLFVIWKNIVSISIYSPSGVWLGRKFVFRFCKAFFWPFYSRLCPDSHWIEIFERYYGQENGLIRTCPLGNRFYDVQKR